MGAVAFDIAFSVQGRLTVSAVQSGGNYVLSSAQFTTVPEPATWLALLSGAIVVGLLGRGRLLRTR